MGRMGFPLEKAPEILTVNGLVLNWNWNQKLYPVYWKLLAELSGFSSVHCALLPAEWIWVFSFMWICWILVVIRMWKFVVGTCEGFYWKLTSLFSSPIIVTCIICWNASQYHQPQFCINMLIFRMKSLISFQ